MRKYYIFVLILSFGLTGVFTFLGVNRVLPPFPALTGVIMSIGGGIGAVLDMNSRR